MEMHGEHRISADRQTVWDALNEPAVLKNCLEGCESFDKVSDSEFKARMTTKVGPIKTIFSCSIRLSDIDPPNSYTISGQGDGGASGYAKGSVKVSLMESEGTTVLHYEVDASLRGKIGQMGSRVVDSVARSMAEKFFGRLTVIVNESKSVDSTIEPSKLNIGKPVARMVIIAIAVCIGACGLGYLIFFG